MAQEYKTNLRGSYSDRIIIQPQLIIDWLNNHKVQDVSTEIQKVDSDKSIAMVCWRQWG